ncbi:Fc.00g087490.m01.CDS01 [Cosmosporella sp. VM-42]
MGICGLAALCSTLTGAGAGVKASMEPQCPGKLSFSGGKELLHSRGSVGVPRSTLEDITVLFSRASDYINFALIAFSSTSRGYVPFKKAAAGAELGPFDTNNYHAKKEELW